MQKLLSILMEESDIEELKKIAKKEGRLVSSHARFILLKYIDTYKKENNESRKEET